VITADRHAGRSVQARTRQRRGNALPFAAHVLAVAVLAGCARREPPPANEVVALRAAALASDPGDAAWARAPEFVAPLIPQDMVEPRQLVASTGVVRVRALQDGTRIAFRLAWVDSTFDDLPRPARFSDACAVQLPQHFGPDLPAPQMGEAGKPVEITYWSAAWQAVVNGRPDSIQAIYPRATVDHYPYAAPSLAKDRVAQEEFARRYAPARALGSPQSHPPGQPVQDLLAEGPGTLTPAATTRSTGRGAYAKTLWSVVLVRPLPETMRSTDRAQVAFAVWNGGAGEIGARKMRTGWVPMSLGGAP